MTKSFEETYPKYPFSRLVKFGVLFAAYALSVARKWKSNRGKAAKNIQRGVPGTEQGETNG